MTTPWLQQRGTEQRDAEQLGSELAQRLEPGREHRERPPRTLAAAHEQQRDDGAAHAGGEDRHQRECPTDEGGSAARGGPREVAPQRALEAVRVLAVTGHELGPAEQWILGDGGERLTVTAHEHRL